MKDNKSFSDFESIEDLKKYLKSTPNLVIELNANEKWIGWCQLKADQINEKVEFYDIYSEVNEEVITVSKNDDGTQNVKIEEEFEEGFNYKKEVHQLDYYDWSSGIIEVDFFLKKIDDFIDESGEGDMYDFYDYLENLIIDDVGSSPSSILEYFECKKCNNGVGTEMYQNDISWFVADTVDGGEFEFTFKSN